MNWKLHVTVAAIVEQAGHFLCVEETIDGRMRINQPAGHLEARESLREAVVREVLEETARSFVPEALIGIYLWRGPDDENSFLRATFSGRVGEPDPTRALDTGIERTLWLSRDEILARRPDWRSPLVLRCIDDYLAGRRYPLETLVDMLDPD